VRSSSQAYSAHKTRAFCLALSSLPIKILALLTDGRVVAVACRRGYVQTYDSPSFDLAVWWGKGGLNNIYTLILPCERLDVGANDGLVFLWIFRVVSPQPRVATTSASILFVVG